MGRAKTASGARVNLVYQPYARGGADGQAVVCPLLRGSSATRGVAPKQHRGPRVNLVYQPYARGGADGQAVVCPLLRGSSATRGVAPKQHRGLRRAFSPAFFGTGSLDPLARGCRRIWRGEGWFRPARCCSTGAGRLDLDLLISGPRVNLVYHP